MSAASREKGTAMMGTRTPKELTLSSRPHSGPRSVSACRGAFGARLADDLLPCTYAVWLLVVVLLYPLCRWVAAVKDRRQDWWLSYLSRTGLAVHSTGFPPTVALMRIR